MSNLINRVREISKSIKDLEGRKATEDEARGFRTRANELADLATQIRTPVQRIELFRVNGIAVETPEYQASQLRPTLEAMLQDYSANRKSILEASSDWRFTTKNGLLSINTNGNQQLLSAWQNHVMGLRPPVNDGLLRLLARSPAYQTQSQQIGELVAEMDHLSNLLPSSREEVEKPAILARDIEVLQGQIPEDLPEPVSLLFQSMNQGTATAVQLTDAAMEWLKQNEMLSDLRVSWR